MATEFQRVKYESLHSLCMQVFRKAGFSDEDARITTEVLLSADLRGVDSHGVARLSFYLGNIKDGLILTNATATTVQETPTTALIDAGGGMGPPVSYRAMQLAIQKALDYGAGFVAVRNSNHYGIAGYYAMMALEHGCIGISMTNAAVFVVPTFGRNAMLGTNPIAVAAPAANNRPYVLDMATSTVPFGKIETYNRLDKPIPEGWATDETGSSTTDTARVIKNLRRGGKPQGGLTPVGGDGELMGGHKGYGLVLLVDVLCGVLSGSLYADLVYPSTPEGQKLPSGVGHFFGAMRVDAFRPLVDFAADMDDLQNRLKNSPKAEGQERIYIHGEKEYEETERRSQQGIPLNAKVLADLQRIAQEFDVKFDV